MKPATVAEYRRKVDAFPHKNKPLRTITRGMVADFLDGLLSSGWSKRTRNQDAALFSAIYKGAIRREKANANPFEGQRLKGVAQFHYEPFTDAELATLFADAKLESRAGQAHHSNCAAMGQLDCGVHRLPPRRDREPDGQRHQRDRWGVVL